MRTVQFGHISVRGESGPCPALRSGGKAGGTKASTCCSKTVWSNLRLNRFEDGCFHGIRKIGQCIMITKRYRLARKIFVLCEPQRKQYRLHTKTQAIETKSRLQVGSLDTLLDSLYREKSSGISSGLAGRTFAFGAGEPFASSFGEAIDCRTLKRECRGS